MEKPLKCIKIIGERIKERDFKMNIKQAKEEIKHTVAAYLSKDAQGEYRIPVVRQRPILLMGPPGIGKTQIMDRSPWNVRSGWSPTRSRITRDKVQSDFQ